MLRWSLLIDQVYCKKNEMQLLFDVNRFEKSHHMWMTVTIILKARVFVTPWTRKGNKTHVNMLERDRNAEPLLKDIWKRWGHVQPIVYTYRTTPSMPFTSSKYYGYILRVPFLISAQTWQPQLTGQTACNSRQSRKCFFFADWRLDFDSYPSEPWNRIF